MDMHPSASESVHEWVANGQESRATDYGRKAMTMKTNLQIEVEVVPPSLDPDRSIYWNVYVRGFAERDTHEEISRAVWVALRGGK